MKPLPAQHLDVVGRPFPDILNGTKTHTIRWQEARADIGELIFTNVDDRSQQAIVQVTRCSDVPLRDAASLVGKQDIWPADVMLDGMRAHYPDITLDDTVQVVEFRYLGLT